MGDVVQPDLPTMNDKFFGKSNEEIQEIDDAFVEKWKKKNREIAMIWEDMNFRALLKIIKDRNIAIEMFVDLYSYPCGYERFVKKYWIKLYTDHQFHNVWVYRRDEKKWPNKEPLEIEEDILYN